MIGELYQTCEHRNCRTEGICSRCFRCVTHCECPRPLTDTELAVKAAQTAAAQASETERKARVATMSPADLLPFIECQMQSGRWSVVRKADWYLAEAVAFDAVYAPRVNRTPLTTAEEVLRFLAAGNVLPFGSDWHNRLRLSEQAGV